MTTDDFQRVAVLFAQLRDLAEADREDALNAACAGDSELRAWVLRLLEADRGATEGSFLKRRAIEDAARLLATEAYDSSGADSPECGTTIGRYRLDARIGAGGMGVVYRAHDIQLLRPVAVKILPTSAADSAERIARFQREARAASQLNHPNIVSIFDAAADLGYHYIAMELVDGRMLRELSASPSQLPDATTILDLMSQAASALSVAHEVGILHRDIKPENIMVRSDGIVKVLDFGLAKLREPGSGETAGVELRTRAGDVMGTMHYLSPEQVRGKPAGAPSDLFSLGVVAYELATGVRPFDGPTDGAVMDAILHHTPPPPSAVRPSLGAGLDSLILRALEKDPELRFQTASDLRSACRLLARNYAVGPVKPASVAPDGRGSRYWWRIAAAVLAAVALPSVYLALTGPAPVPRVERIVQLTRDGLPKRYFVNDGTRVFYSAGPTDPSSEMFQVNAKGGDPVAMPRLAGMFPLDISKDHSELLLGQFVKDSSAGFPIWVVDTVGGGPRRVGGLMAEYASWSPRGNEILYSVSQEMRVARSDGAPSRTLPKAPARVQFPSWSPDGRTIRFTMPAMKTVWEMADDGTGMHAVFPDWTGRPHEGGAWTPDGGQFLFAAQSEENTLDLWTIGQRRGWADWRTPHPQRLTTGPMIAHRPQSSPDGRRLFFLGGPDHGQLVRYDQESDRWTPYLGGLSAMQLDFSRDGKWVTYVSCPQGSVWRAKTDGTERLQLTVAPLFARNPRWSPDGTQIVFYGSGRAGGDRLYVAPAGGGALRQLTSGESAGDQDGSWSPDGERIVFARVNPLGKPDLEIIDVKTGDVLKLPGSENLWSARWSPDGRYVAALGIPRGIWLYELATGTRKELTDMGVGFPFWSRDSRYIHFKDPANTAWYRVGIEDAKLERMASLKGVNMAPAGMGWIGLTPDGSLMATRDAGSTEIYALDWHVR